MRRSPPSSATAGRPEGEGERGASRLAAERSTSARGAAPDWEEDERRREPSLPSGPPPSSLRRRTLAGPDTTRQASPPSPPPPAHSQHAPGPRHSIAHASERQHAQAQSSSSSQLPEPGPSSLHAPSQVHSSQAAVTDVTRVSSHQARPTTSNNANEPILQRMPPPLPQLPEISLEERRRLWFQPETADCIIIVPCPTREHALPDVANPPLTPAQEEEIYQKFQRFKAQRAAAASAGGNGTAVKPAAGPSQLPPGTSSQQRDPNDGLPPLPRRDAKNAYPASSGNPAVGKPRPDDELASLNAVPAKSQNPYRPEVLGTERMSPAQGREHAQRLQAQLSLMDINMNDPPRWPRDEHGKPYAPEGWREKLRSRFGFSAEEQPTVGNYVESVREGSFKRHIFRAHIRVLATEAGLLNRMLTKAVFDEPDLRKGNMNTVSNQTSIGTSQFIKSSRMHWPRFAMHITRPPGDSTNENAEIERILFLPVPDPNSFPLMLHYLYNGKVEPFDAALRRDNVQEIARSKKSLDAINAAAAAGDKATSEQLRQSRLERAQVTPEVLALIPKELKIDCPWRGVIWNVEHLMLSKPLQQFLGGWYKHNIKYVPNAGEIVAQRRAAERAEEERRDREHMEARLKIRAQYEGTAAAEKQGSNELEKGSRRQDEAAGSSSTLTPSNKPSGSRIGASGMDDARESRSRLGDQESRPDVPRTSVQLARDEAETSPALRAPSDASRDELIDSPRAAATELSASLSHDEREDHRRQLRAREAEMERELELARVRERERERDRLWQEEQQRTGRKLEEQERLALQGQTPRRHSEWSYDRRNSPAEYEPHEAERSRAQMGVDQRGERALVAQDPRSEQRIREWDRHRERDLERHRQERELEREREWDSMSYGQRRVGPVSAGTSTGARSRADAEEDATLHSMGPRSMPITCEPSSTSAIDAFNQRRYPSPFTSRQSVAGSLPGPLRTRTSLSGPPFAEQLPQDDSGQSPEPPAWMLQRDRERMIGLGPPQVGPDRMHRDHAVPGPSRPQLPREPEPGLHYFPHLRSSRQPSTSHDSMTRQPNTPTTISDGTEGPESMRPPVAAANPDAASRRTLWRPEEGRHGSPGGPAWLSRHSVDSAFHFLPPSLANERMSRHGSPSLPSPHFPDRIAPPPGTNRPRPAPLELSEAMPYYPGGMPPPQYGHPSQHRPSMAHSVAASPSSPAPPYPPTHRGSWHHDRGPDQAYSGQVRVHPPPLPMASPRGGYPGEEGPHYLPPPWGRNAQDMPPPPLEAGGDRRLAAPWQAQPGHERGARPGAPEYYGHSGPGHPSYPLPSPTAGSGGLMEDASGAIPPVHAWPQARSRRARASGATTANEAGAGANSGGGGGNGAEGGSSTDSDNNNDVVVLGRPPWRSRDVPDPVKRKPNPYLSAGQTRTARLPNYLPPPPPRFPRLPPEFQQAGPGGSAA